jgi:predicted transcriptional regulator
MEVMWAVERATVRQVVAILQERRSIAYTTVMTIMNHLVSKGLLKRIPQGKAYLYRVALSREAFLRRASEEAVSDVLARFGDLAIARFLEVAAKLPPEELERLKELAEGRPAKADEGRRNTHEASDFYAADWNSPGGSGYSAPDGCGRW